MRAQILQFLAFTNKEFLHIFRDIRTILFLFLMPIIQILLFGFALSNEVSNINFAVLDSSHDNQSSKIIQKLANNPNFHFIKSLNQKHEITHTLQDSNIDMILVIENNFARNVANNSANIQILLDASDPNRANVINNYVKMIFLQNSPIIPHITMLFNPQNKSVYNFLPGILGMIMLLICSMMTSISIVRERELGSMEILLTSPIKPIIIILAKFVPYFLISFLSLLGVLGVSIFLLDLNISGNIGLLLFFCMLYILLALSIGLLVSNLANSQITAMLICAIIFMMPTMIFSGMIFPIDSMPPILQIITHFMPAKWFIAGIRKIMVEGLGFEFILKEFFILVFMLIIILLASLKTFKTRL